MLESQTKLPAQKDGATTIWTKGRQLAAAVVDRVEDQVQDLPGSQAAESMRNVGAFVEDQKGQVPFHVYLASFFESIRRGAATDSLFSRYALHFVVVLLAVAVVSIS